MGHPSYFFLLWLWRRSRVPRFAQGLAFHDPQALFENIERDAGFVAIDDERRRQPKSLSNAARPDTGARPEPRP